MADESPVIRQPQRLFTSNGIGGAAVDRRSPENLISDEELSVGGTTPPPPVDFKDEQSDDKEDSVEPNHIKFSIDNILNPGFGNRMSAAESVAAAAALHHHHQLIQHHQASPSAAAAGFLGAFHQLPFLAAARQMILAAASGSSVADYNNPLPLAAQHPASSLLLAAHHPTNTLNLVQSCTDKYLGNTQLKSWTSHQPALPSGVLVNKQSAPSSTTKTTAKTQQVNKCSAPTKAIDLSVRNSSSPPDHRQNRLANGGEKQAAPQVSPSLASSTDDNSSAASPTRSVSVGGSSCSVGNAESGNCGSSGDGQQPALGGSGGDSGKEPLWPAWVYCTRYSDRPSSGPRARRIRSKKDRKAEEKRPRTAFTSEQLARLKTEFNENRYLTEKRRQDLARELQLHENQIKIWFQNKRAKIKKASGQKNPLALQLMAQGLYNHSTMALDEDEEEDDADMLQHPD